MWYQQFLLQIKALLIIVFNKIVFKKPTGKETIIKTNAQQKYFSKSNEKNI